MPGHACVRDELPGSTLLGYSSNALSRSLSPLDEDSEPLITLTDTPQDAAIKRLRYV